MPTKPKTTLRQARESGDLEAFIKERKSSAPANKPRLLKTLEQMEKAERPKTRKRGAETSL